MRAVFRRLMARLRYRHHADDLAEELQAHRAMLEGEFAARGLSAFDARDAARRALGSDLRAREDARAVWRAPWLDQAGQDVRFACRQLRRAPIFSITAILLSGLGVGATTAVYSVVNAVLFAPLPYPAAGRVHALATPSGGGVDGRMFYAVRARSTSHTALAAQRNTGGSSLVVGPYAESVATLRVSDGYFAVLGVPPQAGRSFTPAEDAPGGADVAVISHAVWQRAFGGRPDTLGRPVLLSNVPHVVVGIMPDGFRSVPPVDVWTPLRLSPQDNSVNYLMLGRLRADAAVTQAAAQLELAKADVQAAEPATLHQRTQSLTWMSLGRVVGGELALPLLLLLLAVAATSAVAAANLTGLLLFRTFAREREVATRLALGGSRGRVLRQLLAENVVLAIVGGALGLAVAASMMPALTRMLPATLLVGRAVRLDPAVLSIAVAATAAVALVFALAPVLAARRFDLRAVAGQSVGAFSARHFTWSRRVVLTSEIACTAALLALGSMLGTTLARMYRADLGFEPRDVTVGRMAMSGESTADPGRFQELADRALDGLRAIPGVEIAALANAVPIERGLNLAVAPTTGTRMSVARSVDWRYVTPDYFAALGMSMRRGRAFDDRDRRGAPVAIVNEAFAQAYFGRDDVVSETVFMEASVRDLPRDIVGVVQDSRSKPGAGWTSGFTARGANAPPIVYVPLSQAPARALATTHQYFPSAWIVRTVPGTADLSTAIALAVRRVMPALAFVDIQPLAYAVDADVRGPQVLTAIIGVLALLALGIAAIGIFGLVAYATVVRRRDTAVRLALGASRAVLVRAFLSETVAIAVAGAAVGSALTLGAARLLQSVFGSLATLEPWPTLVTAAILVVVVSAAAAWPAIKASGADPLGPLRVD